MATQESEGAAKAAEVIVAFFGEDVPHRLVRVGRFADHDGARVPLMELERLRKARPHAGGDAPTAATE